MECNEHDDQRCLVETSFEGKYESSAKAQYCGWYYRDGSPDVNALSCHDFPPTDCIVFGNANLSGTQRENPGRLVTIRCTTGMPSNRCSSTSAGQMKTERIAVPTRLSYQLLLLVLFLGAGCAGSSPGQPAIVSRLPVTPTTNAITFWGHSTCYIDIDGLGIVTDPVLSKGYSPLHRRKAPIPLPSSYHNAEIVLISHAHHDHLSKSTLRQFSDSVTILCPEPCAKIIRELGKCIVVMVPGDSYRIPDGQITAVAAHHPGGRNSTNAEPDGRALGFIIETDYGTIYYSGDTDYFEGISEVGLAYRPDLVLLNVNGHLPARDAFRAFRDLGSPRVIPIHAAGYGGPKARMNLRQHAEFAELLGPLASPLRVGESYPLIRNSSVSNENR